MQVERHSITHPEHWQRELAHVTRLSDAMLARAPDEHNAIELARDALRVAAIGSVIPERAPVAGAIQQAAVATAAAFAIARWHDLGAAGELTLPVLQPAFAFGAAWHARGVPIGRASVTLPDWLNGFACAALARDDYALRSLSTPDMLIAAEESADVIDTFWLPLCRAFAALVREPDAASEWLEATQAELGAAQIVPPRQADLRIRPLLGLAQAVAEKSQAAFDAALLRCVKAHAGYWGSGEPQSDYQGFIAWPVAGLAALGAARGLVIGVRSDYLPAAQAPAPGLLATTVTFAPRALLRNDEARWFLDLAGFARPGRTHKVIDAGGLLVARYDLPSSPGIPAARADFVLPDEDSVELPPAALDAGELMHIAAAFAGEEATRASLVEAVSCVDAALARLPEKHDAFESGDFTSPLGRREFEREPGRFRRARLRAYREALAGETADAPPRPGPAPAATPPAATEGEQRIGALAMVEVLKTQVAPMLETLCRTRDESVLEAVRPRAEDYARVFEDAGLAAAVRAIHATQWVTARQIAPPRTEHSRLLVHVAPAGMFATDNELSRHFPGGYRAIAPKLNPHRVWVCWKFTRPGETTGGVSYDGLVWCDDHWAWFPKPYRVLAGSAADAP